MKKSISFSTEINEATNKELAKKYFISQGFILKNESESTLNFTRGSYLLNLVAFDPLKWKSDIQIIIANNSIKVVCEISTLGQIVSKKEEDLWNLFILNFEKYIIQGESIKAINTQASKEVKISSVKLTGWTILGSLIVGIPAGILAHYTNNDNLAIGGALIGGASFFIYFQNK